MSSYSTKGDNTHLSIKFDNLYAINGELTYLTTDTDIDIPHVSKWTSNYYWRPNIKKFPSLDDMTSYISTFERINTVELAVYGDMVWCHNIGHALFDGFYPMYLALVKFGYGDKMFTVFTDINIADKGQEFARKIVEQFSGNLIYNYHTLDKNCIYHFKEFVAGTDSTGNRVITPDYTLYGEKEYSGLSLFKQRIFRTYSLTADKPVCTPLKAIIIHNKRYTVNERKVLEDCIAMYSDIIEIKYVDWQNYSSFADQLQEIENTDIHITGHGTGMMYMPFLKRGAVNINLGYIEKTQTNGARPNLIIADISVNDCILPAYLEQSVCAGANYVNTIYYDRYCFNELEKIPLDKLIKQAISIVGTVIGNNHNIDALIFKEYCRRAKDATIVCKYLTDIAFMIELFVNEHPHAVLKPFVDLELLRKIKEEFKYGKKYDIVTYI